MNCSLVTDTESRCKDSAGGSLEREQSRGAEAMVHARLGDFDVDGEIL